jgi:hypothetical protein
LCNVPIEFPPKTSDEEKITIENEKNKVTQIIPDFMIPNLKKNYPLRTVS